MVLVLILDSRKYGHHQIYLVPFAEMVMLSVFQSETCLASYKIVLKVTNILYNQKVFWSIKGLTNKDESKRHRNVESSNEGMGNINVTCIVHWASGSLRINSTLVKGGIISHPLFACTGLKCKICQSATCGKPESKEFTLFNSAYKHLIILTHTI